MKATFKANILSQRKMNSTTTSKSSFCPSGQGYFFKILPNKKKQSPLSDFVMGWKDYEYL